jgi:Protein of unknown function (DUF3352)
MSTSYDNTTKSNRKWWLIGGGCLALFVCLCIIAIVAVLNVSDSTLAQFRQLAGLGGGSSLSVEYVPASAPMFIVANPSFAQAASAKKVMDILGKNQAIRQRLDDMAKQGAGQNSDFSFDRDVAPWIGSEIAFALLDVPQAQSGSGAATGPSVVLLAATRDTAKSDEALKRFRTAAEAKGTAFTEEQYKGTTIVSGKGPSGSTSSSISNSAYATYQGTVLFSDSADSIKKALDTKQAGAATNLASNANYKSIADKLPKDRALAVVADLRALAKSAGTSATRAPGSENIDAFAGVGLALGFTDDGIRLDSVVTYDPSKLSASASTLLASMQPSPNKVLDVLPDSALAVISGQNIKQLWDFYGSAIAQDPQAKKQFDQSLQGIKTGTGIDVDADIFAWLTGEYALAVVPAKPLAAAGTIAPPVGVMLVIEAKDTTVAKDKLTKISGAAAKQGIAFASKKVNGVDMQVVAGMEAQGITAGYGFLDNFVVIASADDVLSAAVDGKKAPLSKNAEFVLDAKVLPPSNAGVMFFSIPRIIAVVKTSLSTAQVTAFQTDVEPMLINFKGLSLGGSVPKDGVQSSVVFIHVAE